MKFQITNHIGVQVTDVEKAATFYREIMGMHILMQRKNEAEMICGDTVFHMEKSTGRKTFFDFKVDNLEEAKARLERAGCNLLETSCDQGKSYLVSDPFGLKFHMFQERA